MKSIQFTKMEGIGNDYVYIDATKTKIEHPSDLSVKMSDRHFGIGSDGIILIHPSKKADFRMQMLNSDGSEAEMCGNGIRCFAKYLYDHGLTKNETIEIETLAGIKRVTLVKERGEVTKATVDMGEPILERELIPMIGAKGQVVEETLHLDDGVNFQITAVSMGNPHAVIFVEDVKNFPIEKYGPFIENHSLFPRRTNVEFVQVVNENEVIQRTWERGAGETLACGTGASAVTVASSITKRTGKKLTIHLLGGDLEMEWADNNHVMMTGPAREVFTGEWPLR